MTWVLAEHWFRVSPHSITKSIVRCARCSLSISASLKTRYNQPEPGGRREEGLCEIHNQEEPLAQETEIIGSSKAAEPPPRSTHRRTIYTTAVQGRRCLVEHSEEGAGSFG